MPEHRQLSAIMFTDMQGYTSIMRYDEKKAIALREKHREIFQASTLKYNGKVIQYFGDGTLSIFKSTVEAVNCAIDMQLAFQEKPNIPVRIGIHVGDIVYSESDIIGDAVNIASRIEALGEPGSILISDKVHDQIRSHRDIESKFLSVFDLKNVDEAIPVFAISNEGIVVPKAEDIKIRLRHSKVSKRSKINKKRIAIASIIFMLLFLVAYKLYVFKADVTLYEKSIAVLPFDNLSVDDDSEIFSDGITEDILTNLAKIKDLHVISRTSIMQYKNTQKSIPEIAKELGVSYILEGSVQKYGNDIRVTAQLIDGKRDEHIWAENYDKTLVDIFKIQSELSAEIVEELNLNLSFDEIQNIALIPTDNIEAYQNFLKGRNEADLRTVESLEKSIEYYQKAIDLDPKYAEAYAEMANSTFLQAYYSRANPEVASKKATEYLEKAENINNKISRIYTVKGLIYNHNQEYDKAKDAFEKAIVLSPNDVTARHQFATFYFYNQDYVNQLEQTRIAYRLDPLSFATAMSYFTALTYNESFDEAARILPTLEELSGGNNDFIIQRSYMRLYMAIPDYEKAIPHIKEIIKSEPAYRRFLGYAYARLGDTTNAYRIIDSLKLKDNTNVKNHRIAVVFSGLRQNDSVFYYLDTVRNKSNRFNSARINYFDYLKDTPEFKKLLEEHGIEPNETSTYH